MSNVSEKIVDVITMLTDNAIQKAGYDKTIQAQIISCEDATIGKYKCRYQDMIIYAYGSPDTMFNNGSYVYILIPNGDMKKEKTILGTSKKLGINYISQAVGDQAYDIIGNNCINSNKVFYLDSANKNYKYFLYKYGEINEIGLDITSLEQYIYQSSSLIIGGIFKTSIPPIRQYRGHYGITYRLRFLDNTLNQEVIRSYTLDEDNMIDNPYRLVYETRQYQIFDIDGSNFIRIESIEIFNKDFPDATGTITNEKLNKGDIEISNLELSGASRMSENEITGVAISFFTPQGTFFTDSSTSASYKTITAQVRIKGKLVSAAQNIPFYWGIEHVGISPSSEYYNKYLGRGWKCLNSKNIISEGTETSDPVVEWVPSNDTYIFNFDNATARDNKIKVAIVYDGNIVTKTINIQNLGLQTPVLTIQSDKGTKFYYDIGHPNLICKAKIGDQQLNNCTYYWAYENSSGIFEELPETTEQNAQYDAAVAALTSLQEEIAAGTKFANYEAENLTDLETAVKAFNFIQRVKENKIYDVQINRITSFGTFKCSVYNERDIYLGTASITLTNVLDGEDVYSLVINNGSVAFQYNENGVAPNNKSLDTQQAIQGLNFTIYDNLGQPLDSDVIANEKNCKIRWEFPIKETLLVDQQQNGTDSGTDATQTYKYYDNKTNLVYNIAQKYDIRKQRNQIKLTVEYKGMSLTAETNFMFSKQGQPGTNGTEYIVKLVPNTRMNNPPLWPMITKAGSDYILNYGLGSPESQTIIGADVGSSYKLFKAQLWHSGDLVWEGTEADPQKASVSDGITYPTLVHWDILRNQYNKNTQDASAFTVDEATGKITYTGDHLQSAIEVPLANIIKCSITVQGKTYYGTIPITTAWTLNNNYRVNLKDYTGFRYAIYTSDGILPQYDNSHPFEFICMEKINDIWEDVSLVEGDHEITYLLNTVGNYLSTKDGSATNSNLLEILNSEVYRDGCEKNQWIARPAARYDGVCINEAICCIYRQNDQIIGRINVPVHYLLNKFGLAHINDWDGNSVQIDTQGGFILSPQMGAGQKDSNNRFTGILMGEVRNAEKTNPDIGLLGYSQGDRTFFLNSENGSALFGKPNKSQIIVDPNQDKALLYSGNFWQNYDENGLPVNYNSINEKGQGLLIDLTTPQIRYGNGKFSIDENGILRAQDANIKGEITASYLKLTDGATIGTADVEGLNSVAAEQHMIYILKSSSFTTLGKNQCPDYWLDEDTPAHVQDTYNVWTLKRPTYNKDYPNLFISIQKKMVDGTITCTTPLRDDTLTIIDGGHITTGSINASNVDIYNLKASNIVTGILSDKNNNNYWNLDTGEFSLADSTTIGGKTINNIVNGALTQEEIFNKLTNNGEVKGIKLSNGQLYINASYINTGQMKADLITAGQMSADRIQGGTLSLGGKNNQNGILKVYNASGTQIGTWNNTGINIKKGTIQGPSILVGGASNVNGVLKMFDASGKQIGTWDNSGINVSKGSLTTSNKGVYFNLTTGEIGASKLNSIDGTTTLQIGKYNNSPALIIGGRVSDFAIYNNNGATKLSAGYSIVLEAKHQTSTSGGLGRVYANLGAAGMEITTSSGGTGGLSFGAGSGAKVQATWDADTTQVYGKVNFNSTNITIDGNKINTSSSKRYKHDIKNLIDSDLNPHKLLDIPVKQFIFNEDYYPEYKNKIIPGLIAEEVEKVYPAATIYNSKGQVESWDERRIIPGMLALIQQQDKKIKNLESRLEKLEKILIIENK